MNGIKSAFSLAWDQKTNSIFWTDIEKYTINRASINGSNQEVIVQYNLRNNKLNNLSNKKLCTFFIWAIFSFLENPTGLAFDWITDKLYWADEGTKRIEVCNADGSMRAVLFWDQLDKPRDLVVDPIGIFLIGLILTM